MLPITNLLELGRAFRKERKAMGKTQSQIAKDASLRRETVIRIEAGENIDVLTILKAISALGKGLSITTSRPSYEDIERTFNED